MEHNSFGSGRLIGGGKLEDWQQPLLAKEEGSVEGRTTTASQSQMEESQQTQHHHPDRENPQLSRGARRTLLAVNCLILVVGDIGGPLILRLYFLHGGTKTWLSSWLETGGWPVLLFPLLASYLHRRLTSRYGGGRPVKVKAFFMTRRLFLSCAVLGVLTGCDDFLYAYGLMYLPVSTSALLIASQLAFTAFFAFLIVKQRFTPYSLNAVALLTVGAVALALHTSSDRPAGVTKGQYLTGFCLTLGAAALYGFVLPMIELASRKANLRATYTLVMEMQLVLGFFATAFCTVGMIAHNDFQTIAAEASKYTLGEAKYYAVLVFSAIFWQMFFLGAVGVISCGSSLLAGVIIAVLIPVIEVLAVLFYKEKFSSEKGLSLGLCLWGFASYYYGEVREGRKKAKKNKLGEPEMALDAVRE